MQSLNDERMSLYNLTHEISEIFDRITDLGGEISEDDEKALKRANELLLSKVDACIGYRSSIEDMIGLAEAKINQIKTGIARLETRLENFDKYVLTCLEKMPEQKLETPSGSIKIKKPLKKVEIFDETLIPVNFIKIPDPKPTIMKKEIADAIKSGLEVSGARLIDGEKSLIYKTI